MRAKIRFGGVFYSRRYTAKKRRCVDTKRFNHERAYAFLRLDTTLFSLYQERCAGLHPIVSQLFAFERSNESVTLLSSHFA